jgi:hypothetical protein
VSRRAVDPDTTDCVIEAAEVVVVEVRGIKRTTLAGRYIDGIPARWLRRSTYDYGWKETLVGDRSASIRGEIPTSKIALRVDDAAIVISSTEDIPGMVVADRYRLLVLRESKDVVVEKRRRSSGGLTL